MGIYDVLQSYLNLTEKFLGGKQEAWRQTKEGFLAKRGFSSEDLENGSLGAIASLWVLDVDDDDSDVVLSNWSGYPNNIKHEFPNLFRRSFFITAYSIFESRLQNRCKFMEEHFKLKESVTDLPGRGIRRSKNYLEKVVGLKISNPREWHEVLAYNKLRNCFAHNNGYVTKSDDEKFLRDYILKHNFLELDYDETIIQKEFCEEALKNFETFEDYIDESFSKWLISSVKP